VRTRSQGRTVTVDQNHAALEVCSISRVSASNGRADRATRRLQFGSEKYLRIDGNVSGELWDPIAGLYETSDGFVRLVSFARFFCQEPSN
jgi:hypothetical protein